MQKNTNIVIGILVLLFGIIVINYFIGPNTKLNPSDCVGCSYDTCPKQCLAELPRKDAVISEFGNVTGFYSEFTYDPAKDEMDGPLEGEKVTCPRVVISSTAPESIATVLKDMVNQGSSINDIDDKGRLIANIDLSNLSAEQKEVFRKSTENSPVNLNVFRFDYTSPGGASGCFNYLKALMVDEE